MAKNSCLVLACCSVLAAAVLVAAQQAAGPSTPPVPILKFQNDGVNFDGSYQWSYETGNEIVAEEKGYVKKVGPSDEEIQTAEGSYSYTAPDGTRITVTYTADENGFLARGDHLPTPPPVPLAIQRALEFIRSQPQQQDTTETNV